MREADVAIRLRRPAQPDLIQRRLFTVHFHAYASVDYIKRFGEPKSLEDLDNHRIIMLERRPVSAASAEPQLADRSRPQRHGPARVRTSRSTTSSAWCAPASRVSASRRCRTIWSRKTTAWCSCSANPTSIQLDTYFVYPEELKSVARVQVFPGLRGEQGAALACIGSRAAVFEIHPNFWLR